jgi:gluconate 5-dehydrogenase
MRYIDDLFGLKNKVVVITGANGNLGYMICKSFHEAGAKVIATDIFNDKEEEPCDSYKKIDITVESNVKLVFDSIIKEYGSIDILINNAGVSTFEPFEERLEEKIDWVMDVNLKGTFFCIKSFVSICDKYKIPQGNIINIASFYGIISPDFRIYTDTPRKNSEIYGATKAGVIQMTKYFAVHLADRNIRVNAISPGGIYNPKNPQGEDFIKNYSFRCPMKRMANDSEMIGALLYLASDSATYTTGQNIIIDGGMSCW